MEVFAMRLSLSFLVLLLAAGVSLAADLGSPLPIPVATTLSSASGQTERLKMCSCGDNCTCKPGQCPACPTQSVEQSTTSAVATYRQVWIRGMGWVWMQDIPNPPLGGCSSGTCPLNGRSR
jgi:hypothetical protein